MPNKLNEPAALTCNCFPCVDFLPRSGRGCSTVASSPTLVSALATAVSEAITGAQRVRCPQASRGEGGAARVIIPTSIPPRSTGPPESPKQALAPIEPVRLGSTSAYG